MAVRLAGVLLALFCLHGFGDGCVLCFRVFHPRKLPLPPQNKLIHQRWGTFDFDTTQDVISFLSPDRTPGYWHDYSNPNNVMSAKVQGIVCAADLQAARFATKGGYWADGWLEVHLKAYV